ncbi:MAG TPA: VaFE repeat-containing surface-anchored protein [Pilimelia sp.]|nr:VaFE repeat-containing surface-anchored protein [Pilimelia sp.]
MAHSPRPRGAALAAAAALGTVGATVLAGGAFAGPATSGTAVSDVPAQWSAGTLGRPAISVLMSGSSWSASRQGIDIAGGDRLMAYCIELSQTARRGVAMKQIAWSAYPGTDAAEGNLPEINWVVNHSIGTIGRPALETAVNQWLAADGRAPLTNGLQAQEAISGTQAALWRLSDNKSLTSVKTSDARNLADGAVADVRKVYDYFVANAQERAEDAGPTGMSVTAESSSGAAGGLIGPMVVRTTGEKVRLTSGLPAGVHLVDSTGTAIDTHAISDGQKVYVKTAADAPAGAATLSWASENAIVARAGRIFAGASVRTQTYVIGSHQYGAATDTTVVRWTAAPPPVVPPPTQNPDQPVAPAVTTSASDEADGDKTVAPAGGTVVDVVTYTGLKQDTTYTVSGELMDKETGEGTGIKGSRTFTTRAADTAVVDGTVDVSFHVGEAFAGRTLVAFETVREGGTVVAAHRDINDRAQTVGVGVEVAGPPQPAPARPAPPAPAGNGPDLPVTGASLGALIGAGVLGLGVGGVLLVTARRRRAALGVTKL